MRIIIQIRIIVRFFVILIFSGSLLAANDQTHIEILKVKSYHPNYLIFGEISNYSPESQVLVFVREQSNPSLTIVTDNEDNPILPELDKSDLSIKGKPSGWEIEFKLYKRPVEIFVFVCSVNSSEGWNLERDVRALRQLLLEDFSSLNKTVAILENFGWFPTGYTSTRVLP